MTPAPRLQPRRAERDSRSAKRQPPDGLVARTLATTAETFGVTVEELGGPARQRHIVEARHVAAYVLRDAGLSLAAIGEALGGRHHTTVLHAIARVEELAEQSASRRTTVEGLRRRLRRPVNRWADVGTVAIVHPRLPTAMTAAMRSAGFTCMAAGGHRQVWVRYPDA